LRENKPMKLLSVAIPCYNSAAYMRNCIESLLPGGDEVEILIVDDGSTKDNTAEIADEYERNYPGICRAIHQENGGHGEAVNAGLRNATGVYYKVVDSDDWVNEEAYMEVLDTLRKFVHDNVTLDMLITNFVYEKQGAKHKKVMNYNMPAHRLERCKRLPPGTVYPDALGYLPSRNASKLRSGIAEAHILCG
jgi:glycosyltransferase involved in cell wall biosynthesis